MKILAFDSTAKAASVAISEDDKLLALYNIENGLTHSELLLPMIESMMKSLKLEYSDIELFATSVGPGSFTGVRIAAALLKGLAFGRNVPCAEVSTLEALAENAAGIDGIIVPVMDARRNQFYSARFASSDGEITRLSPDEAISADALAEALKGYEGDIFLVGDGYELAKKILTEKGVKTASTPRLLRSQSAYSVAKIARKKHSCGETTSDKALLPSYLRLPQAERERLERNQSK